MDSKRSDQFTTTNQKNIGSRTLKAHKIEIVLASILKFVLFLYKLCQNIKILQKKKFDQAIIGGDTYTVSPTQGLSNGTNLEPI